MRFLRLCLLILVLRRFLSEPMGCFRGWFRVDLFETACWIVQGGGVGKLSVDDFIQRVLNDALRA
jgi:hypothetical protein